jgi:tetratricopeptide (TPR) repeat protein
MAMWGRMLGRSGTSQHYDRGIRLFDQGMYEQAIDAFEHALAEGNGGALVERLARFYLAESHSALALSQISQNSLSPAIANLLEAIKLSPHYADLHYHLGSAYLNQNEPKKALEALERALEINPGYARARLHRGIALYLMDRRSEAFENVEAAVSLDGTLNRDFLQQARDTDTMGDTVTVVRLLKKMGETETDEALFHARLALDLFRRGMLEEAAEEYRQALAVNPNYADLHNQLGVTLYAAGRDEEAITEFVAALAINPRYIEARLNHGLALQRLGRKSDARTAFEEVLKIDPDNQAAQESLQSLDRP